MNAARSAGRPAKGSSSISKADILAHALTLLDKAGERGLTMRSLAKNMSVTPMALYHHVGNRDELIAALVELVFGKIQNTLDEGAEPLDRIEALLLAYCEKAFVHPELLLCVFRNVEAFEGTLSTVTGQLRTDLERSGLTSEEVSNWTGLLVDYTHGFAVSEASGKSSDRAGLAPSYKDNLKLLIAFLRSQQEKLT